MFDKAMFDTSQPIVYDDEHDLLAALGTLEWCCRHSFKDANYYLPVLKNGERFVEGWGGQAIALGWSASTLFGSPFPYRARGLIWFLHGGSAVTLTEMIAVIERDDGRFVYCRDKTVPWWPLGHAKEVLHQGLWK